MYSLCIQYVYRERETEKFLKKKKIKESEKKKLTTVTTKTRRMFIG